MKIITWNCNMVFRKKAEYIFAHKPDILVIPECENQERLKFTEGLQLPTDILWYGKNQHKGIGVFSFNGYKLKLLDCHNASFKNILPISVTDGKIDFILFAIWANNPDDKDGAYVTQVWKALNYYENLLSESKTILIGDFNSNTIWDKPRREGNHSTVIAKLEAKQIFSTYHVFYNQIQGKEEHPTLFMYRHKDKPYHLDYCFASIDFIKNMKSVEIGKYEDWTMHSDHKPLIVEFEL
jgi:exodeoxyribonuclease-3